MDSSAVSIKALEILLFMNKRKITRLKDIHEELGYPKATALRFLTLLIQEGFVTRYENTPYYGVTSHCSALSAGVTKELLFIEKAAPLCEQLTEKLQWPIALSTFEEDHMMIRYSTRPNTKYTFIKSTVGQPFPMFGSAIGEVWLSQFNEKRQNKILKTIHHKNITTRLKRLAQPSPSSYLKTVYEKGYAVRLGRSRESSSLAVPIYLKKRPIATVSISAFAQSVGREFVTDYLNPLRELSNLISERISFK